MSFIKRVSDAASKARENYDRRDQAGKDAFRIRTERELEEATRSWTLPTVMRTFEAGDKQERLFALEGSILDDHGYEALMQDADGGHVHVGRLLLTGGLSVLAGRKGIRSKGKMTVTFRRRPASAPQPDLAEQLQKLAALRDQGILTNEEFAAKKAELLAR